MEKPQSEPGKTHLVLFPCSLSMGHIIPFMDLADKLVTYHAFSVTIITTWQASSAPLYSSYLQPLVVSNPDRIRLLELHHSHGNGEQEEESDPLLAYLVWVDKCMEALQHLLRSCTNPISAFITDFFDVSTLDAATPLSIPTYVFSTTSAANLAFKFHLRKLLSENLDFGEHPDALLEIPGMGSIATRDLPPHLLDKSRPLTRDKFVGLCSRLHELTGIFINSCTELEEKPIRALQEQIQKPKIYPIGPILCSPLFESKVEQQGGVAEWLDKQAESSVVYVSFGSGASMGVEEIAEIAFGLERSGRRFVWLVRGHPSQGSRSCHVLLPEGFHTRVGQRGLVVQSWAPQIRILSHPAIGGFISHSGRNSSLEGIWYGVPFAAWPLRAKQRMNCLSLVNNMEVGLEVKKQRTEA